MPSLCLVLPCAHHQSAWRFDHANEVSVQMYYGIRRTNYELTDGRVQYAHLSLTTNNNHSNASKSRPGGNVGVLFAVLSLIKTPI